MTDIVLMWITLTIRNNEICTFFLHRPVGGSTPWHRAAGRGPGLRVLAQADSAVGVGAYVGVGLGVGAGVGAGAWHVPSTLGPPMAWHHGAACQAPGPVAPWHRAEGRGPGPPRGATAFPDDKLVPIGARHPFTPRAGRGERAAAGDELRGPDESPRKHRRHHPLPGRPSQLVAQVLGHKLGARRAAAPAPAWEAQEHKHHPLRGLPPQLLAKSQGHKLGAPGAPASARVDTPEPCPEPGSDEEAAGGEPQEEEEDGKRAAAGGPRDDTSWTVQKPGYWVRCLLQHEPFVASPRRPR